MSKFSRVKVLTSSNKDTCFCVRIYYSFFSMIDTIIAGFVKFIKYRFGFSCVTEVLIQLCTFLSFFHKGKFLLNISCNHHYCQPGEESPRQGPPPIHKKTLTLTGRVWSSKMFKIPPQDLTFLRTDNPGGLEGCISAMAMIWSLLAKNNVCLNIQQSQMNLWMSWN